jgi:hypothetical protein
MPILHMVNKKAGCTSRCVLKLQPFSMVPPGRGLIARDCQIEGICPYPHDRSFLHDLKPDSNNHHEHRSDLDLVAKKIGAFSPYFLAVRDLIVLFFVDVVSLYRAVALDKVDLGSVVP